MSQKECALIFAVLVHLHLSLVLSSEVTTMFNSEYVSVVFDPRIEFWKPGFLNVSTIVKILKVVASRFLKIQTFSIDEKSKEIGKEVLLAVAEYNKHCKTLGEKPVEIEISYKPSGSGRDTSLIEDLLKTATQSNQIFNGSITTIYLMLGKANLRFLETFLIQAEKVSVLAPVTYKFGIQISFSESNKLCWYLKQKQWPALSQLNYITLWANQPNSAGEAPHHILKRLTEKFLKMRHKLIQIKHENSMILNLTSANIIVTLATGFAGLKDRRDATLVEYWQYFAHWANITKNKVLLHEAIDSKTAGKYEDESIWLKRGWWRVVTEGGTFGVTNFTLQEKGTVVLTDISNDMPNIVARDADLINSTQVVTICITTGVLMVVVIFVWVYFHTQAVEKILKQSIEQKKQLQNLLDFYNSPNPGLAKKFHVTNSRFKIDELQVLGLGSSGVVCAAKLRKYQEWIEAAVKMPTAADATFGISAILNEVVILGRLETHKNITEMLGVNTANINQGKVYVFYEISTHGSMEKVLKTMQSNTTVTKETQSGSVGISEKNLSKDMLQWTIGIAKGMEYLTANHIIHTDLATRNVLLGNDNEAKICDFGFARSSYVECSFKSSRDVELAWRWASPETIVGNMFSEKTDVWSFGVTVWEMFSLAELPYNDLTDCKVLIQQLKHGRKLAEPKLANSNMCGIMTSCWSYHPSLRPTFTDIVKSLEKQVVTYDTVV